MKAIPGVSGEIERKKKEALGKMEEKMKMKDDPIAFEGWKKSGLTKDEIMDIMNTFSTKESHSWKDGMLSGKVYNGRQEINEVCNLSLIAS